MIDLRRRKHAARARALFALTEIPVAFQYQQTQSIPLCPVTTLVSVASLMVSLPPNSIPRVRIAVARNANQRGTAPMATWK